MEAKSEEGHVGCKCYITESADAVLPLKQAFPVGFQCRSAWRVVPIQVGVKNVNGFLVDGGFKFAGEERGPCQLLLGEKREQSVIGCFSNTPASIQQSSRLYNHIDVKCVSFCFRSSFGDNKILLNVG